MNLRIISLFLLVGLLVLACGTTSSPDSTSSTTPSKAVPTERMRVLLDTDANNELDDQHAIAYLLFNGDYFDIEGISVNRTRSGGPISAHLAEAERVVAMCQMSEKLPVMRGADASFAEILPHLSEPDFDGQEAVDFIVARAKASDDRPLVLLPIGKLTNIALAIAKAPEIIPNIRIVWLGSNYPEPGEYNQDNDTSALTYLLATELATPFEMVTVRYGKPSGTDAVRATPAEIQANMPEKGPRIEPAVPGRHGELHHHFGDYAVSLFEKIDLHGDPPSRALFDMVAVAILKDPSWAEANPVAAPRLINNQWVEQPGNSIQMIVWENFDAAPIMDDFYKSMAKYQLPK